MGKIFITSISLIATIFLVGCTIIGGTKVSTITPEVANAIAYCNGGIDSETGLKIEATIESNGGKINAALGDKLYGMFLNKPGLTSGDAVTAQKQYMECLERKASREKVSSVNDCQAKLTCEIDTLQMLCNCRTAINEIALEKGFSNTFRDKQLAEKCYSGQYDVRKCWPSADINNARAACTVSLQQDGRELPTAMKGTCLAKDKG